MDANFQKDPGDLETPAKVEEVSLGEASRRHNHMAFTIHFSDATNGAPTRNSRDAMNNYGLKHRRNQSYSCTSTEENKTTKGEVNAALAVSLSPVPVRKAVTSRRAGYHSEGYFSSDQEEELKNKSGFFVKKLKTLEKGLRKTNLAQEKKNMEEHTSQVVKLNNSPHLGRHAFGDFHVEEPSLKIRLNDFEHYNSTTSSASINNMPQEAPNQQEWTASNSDDDIEVPTDAFDNVLHIDDEDIDNDMVNDAASETGTYTIDKDISCLEEEQARQEIDEVVVNSSLPAEDIAGDSSYSLSSYRSGSNWINDWASQVAQHAHHQETVVTGLPPLPTDKHAGHVNTHKASSSAVTHIKSPRQSPDGSLRRTHQRGPLSPPSRHSPVLPVDQHIEETQSFLRATESVVSAMQARMSMSLDSGGESDVETSHSYQPMKRGGSASERQDLARRCSGASDGSARRTLSRGAQSDEVNSEASELKNKKIEHPPQMRYNRAFSLRRARLESEPESSPPSDRKKMMDALPASVSKLKKSVEPAKPNPPLQPKVTVPNSPKPKSIARTDCGRFSVRTPKPAPPQPTAPAKPTPIVKKGSKKTGGRSNSTLSSREVEFQNWKRRKSYDPMKAAAEGKKKDAAKKATFNSSMTQSTTTVEELSESLQNPVLRSASFHGTAGLGPNTYISSEDEESPTSEFPPYLDTVAGSPVKLSGEGTNGGSRVSLHSTASNSSLRGRTKFEALDSLVVAALCGLSNKLRASCCVVLKKLRYLYEEDYDKTEQLSAIIDLLESPTQPGSPQSRSPSKEISGTLKNLKQIESVIKVLDEILFDGEEFDDVESDTLQ